MARRLGMEQSVFLQRIPLEHLISVYMILLLLAMYASEMMVNKLVELVVVHPKDQQYKTYLFNTQNAECG